MGSTLNTRQEVQTLGQTTFLGTIHTHELVGIKIRSVRGRNGLIVLSPGALLMTARNQAVTIHGAVIARRWLTRS